MHQHHQPLHQPSQNSSQSLPRNVYQLKNALILHLLQPTIHDAIAPLKGGLCSRFHEVPTSSVATLIASAMGWKLLDKWQEPRKMLSGSPRQSDSLNFKDVGLPARLPWAPHAITAFASCIQQDHAGTYDNYYERTS